MIWMGSMADIATITAYDTTNLQDGIVFAAIAELKFLMLKKASTTTPDSTTVWSATPSGRWHLVGGGGSSALATVSDAEPTTVLPAGSIYVWQEDTSGSFPADPQGRYPDSVITYVSNGVIWVTVSANKIIYELAPGATPTTLGKVPNDVQETFLDTNTNTTYGAVISSSSVLSWVAL